MQRHLLFCCLLAFLPVHAAIAGEVVINEIFYHSPDDIPELEWIELHNTADKQVDVSGWAFAEAVEFKFPQGTVIKPDGYLVVAKDPGLFREFYETPVIGGYAKLLGNGRDTLVLSNAAGEPLEKVAYRDREPWPVAADGYSSSLERIAPSADANVAQNWAASPLPEDAKRPAGSPGVRNTAFAKALPPVVTDLTATPDQPKPGQSMRVTAALRSAGPLEKVELLYRIVEPGKVGEELSLTMKTEGDGRYAGQLPGQPAGVLIRYRVRATDSAGLVRLHPSQTDLRPALSAYVMKPSDPGKIPFAFVINSAKEDVVAAEQAWKSKRQGGRVGGGRARMSLIRALMGLDLSQQWFALTVEQELDDATRKRVREVLKTRQAEAAKLKAKSLAADNAGAELRAVGGRMQGFQSETVEQLVKVLPEAIAKKFQESQQGGTSGQNPDAVLKQLLRIEPLWFALSMEFEFDKKREGELHKILRDAAKLRSEQAPLVRKAMSREIGFQELQEGLGKVEQQMLEQLQPALSFRQKRFANAWRASQGSPIRPRTAPVRAIPPRGNSTFVFVDPDTGKPEVFDFVHVRDRSAGYKIRLHRDRPLKQMTTINVIFEYKDRFVLAEPLAFEFYRRSGNAACQTDFVRLWVDGRLQGYQLMFEQPNRSFLRRNKLKGDGNLYKLIWYGNSIVDKHEKKSNPDSGHGDLLEVINLLNSTKGEQQWQVIEKHFNVPQMINYFAVNMCLSHWDGFFNNYYAYHDVGGAGKWELYAWDQDKTWGFYDAIRPGTEFTDMPLTFGMDGDKPPGGGQVGFRSWWRPGGHFSGPLLANEKFRKLFLSRTKEILDEIYCEETFFPIIDEMAETLRAEVPIRAAAIGEPENRAVSRFEANIRSLKRHLTKRREFLLEQDELKSVEE